MGRPRRMMGLTLCQHRALKLHSSMLTGIVGHPLWRGLDNWLISHNCTVQKDNNESGLCYANTYRVFLHIKFFHWTKYDVISNGVNLYSAHRAQLHFNFIYYTLNGYLIVTLIYNLKKKTTITNYNYITILIKKYQL